jgi:hypothetical protein
MAYLVGGVGVSHSPQLSIPADGWRAHGDLEQSRLRSMELPESPRAAADMPGELTSDTLRTRYARCQKALESTAAALIAMRPDVLVIIGDDQHELFLDDIIPAVSIFWGSAIDDLPPGMSAYPATMEAAYRYYHAETKESYATEPSLGLHMVSTLVRESFDVAQLTQQPAGRSLGHAFTFVYRRLLHGLQHPPMVPVFLNTYYPPNQPTPRRCIDFGRALGAAISAWPPEKRVALVASGGLTHPIIDEGLDRRLLDDLARADYDDLAYLPVDVLVEGSSEIRNWIAVGAALEAVRGRLVDYVPAYRSVAGSGCGMGFFVWDGSSKPVAA